MIQWSVTVNILIRLSHQTDIVFQSTSLIDRIIHSFVIPFSVKYPENSSGVLSLLLMFYMTGLCTKTAASHITSIYVAELKQLPWRELRPDLQLLETMVKVGFI